MVEENEIIGLFQELKKSIDKDREFIKSLKTIIDETSIIDQESKTFLMRSWECIIEGRKKTAFEICKYFEDIGRHELSKPCKEIFEIREER